MKKLIMILCMMLFASFANAKTYKVFLGTPAGSGSDIQTRKLFDEVSKETGDTFVVLNKPGANFLISYNAFLEEVKNGQPAILYNATTLSIALMNKGETPEVKGLIALHKVHYYLVVKEESYIKTVSDMKKLNIGSTSLVSELLLKTYLSGIDYAIIPYKSENESTLALLKNEVDAISTNSLNNLLLSQPDKFRMLSVYPENVVGITGYSVSKDFSEVDRKQLNSVMNKIIRSSEYSTWMKNTFGINVEGGSVNRYDELNDKLLNEIVKVKKK